MSEEVVSESVVSSVAGLVPQQPKSAPRTIYISSALDVMEALIKNGVDDSIYMFDNNKTGGSTGLGTNELHTVVNPGDVIVWMISGLEVETFTDIHQITGPAVSGLGIHQAEQYGTKYWTCTIDKGARGRYEYTMEIQVESKFFTLGTTPTITVVTEDN